MPAVTTATSAEKSAELSNRRVRRRWLRRVLFLGVFLFLAINLLAFVQARSIYDHLPGRKRLESFEQAGHCEFFSSDPARWRGAINLFLISATGA